MEYSYADKIATHIQNNIKGLYRVGSIRRKEDIINDIDFITKRDLHDVINDVKELYDYVLHAFGEKYCSFSIETDKGLKKIDIWRSHNKEEYERMKILRTLDTGHFIGLRKKAKKRGLTLSEKGLHNPLTNEYVHFKNKKELKSLL
jgi:DNA polymerase/3'-5' exonuclease PolX